MTLKHYSDLSLKHLIKETLPIPHVKGLVGEVKCVSRFIIQKDRKSISLPPIFDRTGALGETTRKKPWSVPVIKQKLLFFMFEFPCIIS